MGNSSSSRSISSKIPTVPVQSSKPPEDSSLTLGYCINLFKMVHNAGDANNVIDAINKLLDSIENKSKKDKRKSIVESETTENGSLWRSLLNSGGAFLEFVNKHIQRGQEKGDFIFQLGETRKPVAEILQAVGKMHWIIGGLSIVAYLLDQIDQMRENRTECLELLRQMLKLAGHIRQLNYDMPQYEKKFSEAIFLIVEGSMMCASQLNSKALFRFLKSFVNSKSLSDLQSKINQLYQDLTLTAVIAVNHQLPIIASPSQPIYPSYAVGIEQQIHQLMQLLDMTTREKTSWAVVIYGFGGIGKTTLAKAVVAKSKTILKDYNYCGIELYEEPFKNDFKSLQQKILNDAFPNYYGKHVIIRDCADGRYHLMEALKSEANKPAFIYIDNVLRAPYLKELLPENLKCLPQHSRILITTRNLAVADVLVERGLERRKYCVNTLSPDNAKKILCEDPSNPRYNKNDMDRIVRICNGIPLVLKIVGVRLKKQGYKAEKCSQILEALEKGKDIKEDNLSGRLVDFVYKEFEASTQEAFLDICSFFNNWDIHHVRYIVGAEEVTSLEEAALVNSSDENKLNVHDVIMAKGRNMSQSNRIMDQQALSENDRRNLKEIKGVWLMEDKSTYVLQESSLNSMKDSLRVLALGNQIRVNRQSQQNFKELRFLRIGGNIPCLPVNLQKLDRLAVFHGPIFVEGFSLHQIQV
ncbi:TMV resistance protein N isoform X2 [Cryptomeria japonica]|uniref:TMV resistance protein N isoform X2 n=1 Tax=Cryptomeria japonica TaxID=3369 RepID=UPI0027DA087B|nr:TMV resistance protein N isoform X2 [Cryptomeria japonica]